MVILDTYEFVDEQYWEVTDKFGTVYKFGTSSPARQYDPNETDHINRWMLEEVRDRNGNYISYTYYRHGNQLYPETITYTGNGGTPGIFTVDFLRESRSDVATSYKTGFPVHSQYRVNQILVEVNGSWVRKYDIAYQNGDNGGRSMISSITETGRDDQGTTLALPASTITYQTQSGGGWLATAGWSVPTAFARTFSVTGVDNGARVADFNGDGLPDIAQYREDEGSGKIHINNGDGTWSTTTPSGLLAFATQAGADTGVRVADVNGDGLADFVDQAGNSAWINTNNGSSFVEDNSWALPV